MASIKIILWKHDKKKDGTFPLALRITQNRKTRYIFTGKYIFEKDWDAAASKIKKSYPNSTRLNNFLLTKLKEANKTLLDLETEDQTISSKQVKKEITSPLSNKSFNEISRIYINELEDNKKLTRLSSDRARVNHLIEFAKSDNINFREIDEAFLRRYITFLKIKKKNAQRSVINALIVFAQFIIERSKWVLLTVNIILLAQTRYELNFPKPKKLACQLKR